MKTLVRLCAVVCLLTGLSFAQNSVFNVTSSNTAVTATTAGFSAILKENSSSPTATFDVYDGVNASPVHIGSGGIYVFTRDRGYPFVSANVLGYVKQTNGSGPTQFVLQQVSSSAITYSITNTGGAISSVFGRTGAVVAASNDYSFAQLSGTSAVVLNNQVNAFAAVTDPGSLSAGQFWYSVADNRFHVVNSVTNRYLLGLAAADSTAAGTLICKDSNGNAGTSGCVATESQITNLVSDLGLKAPLASPTFTGTPAAPTPLTADNSTTVATTAYVKSNLASYLTSATAASTYAPLASPTFTGTVGGITAAMVANAVASNAVNTFSAVSDPGSPSAGQFWYSVADSRFHIVNSATHRYLLGLINTDAAATGTPICKDSNGNATTSGCSAASSFVGLGSVSNVAQLPASYLDTDGTLAANSDVKVASQKAVKTYVAANWAQVYNVVTQYGAKADFQTNSSGSTTTSGQPTVTCAACAFTNADVGKKIWVNGASSTHITGTILSVSSGVATVSNNATATATGGFAVYWGTDNSTAFQNAVTAAKAAVANGLNSQQILGGQVYVPCGMYVVASTPFDISSATSSQGVQTVGQGSGCTFIVPSQDFAWVNNGRGQLFKSGNTSAYLLKGISFFGYPALSAGFTSYIVELTTGGNWQQQMKGAVVEDVNIENFVQGASTPFIGFKVGGANTTVRESWSQGNDQNCYVNASGGVTFIETYCGNAASSFNLQVNNITGNETSTGFRFIGGLIDGCGRNTATAGCTDIINSNDVEFIGTSLFTGAGVSPAVSVDATSDVTFTGTVVGPYLNATNGNALYIASGGVARATGSKFMGKGTGISLSNSGTFYDVGGNRWRHCTTTTQPCPSATIAQAFSGTNPVSALTHSTYNFFAASNTAQTWMKQTIDQPIQITRIQVTPGNGASVNCTVAPVIQITDGTTALTVNVANATATDDSGVLTQTYASGAALQFNVSAAGTCTTAPTNYNVSVLWSSIAPSN